MDYNSLIEQMQQYTKRTDADFVNQIPNFIEQAINRIYYEAKDIGFEAVRSGQLRPNIPLQQIVFDLNWKETLSFTLLDVRLNPIAQTLWPRSYEFCLSYWPSLDNAGMPLFYSMRQYGDFYIVPIPDANYSYELNYLGLPLLNAQNPRNFLTDRYPSLLLNATLVEAMSYLKDDDRIAIFEAAYGRALQDTNRNTKERYIDRTAKRDKD